MQHSPQEIKSRLDKAVDPEGNVLDMVAVLELVTTLERLPLTREALETTRIGKTINLLRKKTSNDDLAKRAKKLVKKWQKLVINQIEASRSIDSPLNGSRISSPQINGTIRDKSSTTLIDRTIKGKKGVKRKRSTSSLSSSPLTLSQDSPCTPSDNNSSNPSSPFPSATELAHAKQSTLSNESKKPKLMDECRGKNGGKLVQNEEPLPTKSPISECDGKNNVNKTQLCSNKDVHTIINTTQDTFTSNSVETSNSQENNLSQSLDSFYTDSGIDSLASNVNMCSYSSQHTPDQEIESNNSNSIQSNLQQEFENEIECKDEHIKHLSVKNGTSLPNNETVGKSNDGTDTRITDNEISKVQASDQSTEEQSISVAEAEVLGQLDDTSKPFGTEDLESEKMDDEPLEPKELILDINQEANGINGRFNDQGVWYSWTDMMPNNDGNLHILPYVILD